MGNPFAYDSPVMTFIRKAMDLVLLNLLTMICCIPIVTIGASVSAAHYAAAKIRVDEGHVSGNFFHAFGQNFKKGTLLWLVILAVSVFLISGYTISRQLPVAMADVSQVVILIVGALAAVVTVWIFPLQMRYENKIGHTLKNAATLTVAYLPTTLLMLAVYLLPMILFAFVAETFFLLPFFGISAPIYWNGPLYTKILDKVDEIQAEKSEEEA